MKKDIERTVRNKGATYELWAACQTKVRCGSPGEYIGQRTILRIAGDCVGLTAKNGTSLADFEKEARAIKLLK